MRINENIPIFGDLSFRGVCPNEDIEQINFYSWLRFNYPDYAELFIHPKAEGKRSFAQINYEKRTGGIPSSMPDCMIISSTPFCVELKRQDHTKSKWQPGQQEMLDSLSSSGCFVGVALGCEAMKEAFLKWLTIIESQCQSDIMNTTPNG